MLFSANHVYVFGCEEENRFKCERISGENENSMNSSFHGGKLLRRSVYYRVLEAVLSGDFLCGKHI